MRCEWEITCYSGFVCRLGSTRQMELNQPWRSPSPDKATMQRSLSSRMPKLLTIRFLLLATLVASTRADSRILASAVDSVDMTVSDMDRALDFYSRVLTFKKVSDTEVAGEAYENLESVFGVRMRVVRMQLGNEFIELTEYL